MIATRLRHRLLRLLTGSPLVVAIACGDMDANSNLAIDKTSQELFTPSGATLWSSPIPVCFKPAIWDGTTSPGWDKYKERFRDLVDRSWAEYGNITVNYTQTCPNTTDPYVTILGSPDSYNGQAASVGTAVLSPANSTTAWSVGMGILRPDFGYVAVHEFGHVLGFGHEHERNDVPGGPGGAPNGTYWTSYDPNSNMNYNGPNTDALSAVDIQGLQAAYGARQSGYFDPKSTWASTGYSGTRATAYADVTGDGLADGIVVNETGVTVRRSTGVGLSPNETWISSAYYGNIDTVFADVDGDGRADAIAINTNGITVRTSTGSSFGSAADWTSGAFSGTLRTRIADVDGDGKADAVAVNSNGISVRRSLGNQFSATVEPWSTAALNGNRDTLLADVNRDRRADLVAINDTEIRVALSNGVNGFGSAQPWTTGPFYGTWTEVQDVNGDGRADAIALDGIVRVRLSTGTAFGPEELQTVETIAQYARIADVTGDGKGDLIVGSSTSVIVRPAPASRFAADVRWPGAPYYGGLETWHDWQTGGVSTVPGGSGDKGSVLIDVTGDHKADLVLVNNDKILVRRALPEGSATGTSFGSPEDWTGGPFWGWYGTMFADVDGDQKADALVVNTNGVTVRRSTGSGFSANETWSTIPWQTSNPPPTAPPFASRGTFFADVTGEGRADCIRLFDDRIEVLRSTGSAFSSTIEIWSSVGFYGTRGTFFADVTLDGRADAIAVNDNGVTVRRATEAGAFSGNESWTTGAYYGTRGTFFADVTQDGRADAIAVNDNGVAVRRATEAGVFSANESWTTGAYYGTLRTLFADVTGDSKADAVVINASPGNVGAGDGVIVRASSGTSFDGNETWVGPRPSDGSGWYFADVTGDGRPDGISVDAAAVSVRPSVNSNFGDKQNWLTGNFVGSKGNAFVDVTGDVYADAVIVGDTGITVRRSTGSGFSVTTETWSAVAFYGTRGTFFADVTGEGRADAIAVNDNGITVRRSTGTVFSGNETWSSVGYYGALGTFFADVTGDGKADAIAVNSNGVTVRRSTGSGFSGNESWFPSGIADIFFADVTGDGRADMILPNTDGTYVAVSTGYIFGVDKSWSGVGVNSGTIKGILDMDGDKRADMILSVAPEPGFNVRSAR